VSEKEADHGGVIIARFLFFEKADTTGRRSRRISMWFILP
jgi:hypothetical protein